MEMIDKKEIELLYENMMKANIHIVIKKNCGYRFLISLNEESYLSDLYNQVQRFYNHIDKEKLILYNLKCNICDHDCKNIREDLKKIEKDKLIFSDNLIPNSDLSINNYIFKNKIKPCTKYPNDIMYKFYLNIIKLKYKLKNLYFLIFYFIIIFF